MALRVAKALAFPPSQWASRPGIEPVVGRVHVLKSTIKELEATPQNVTLRIGARRIEKLIYLGSEACSVPALEHVCVDAILADRRYLWSRKNLEKIYNVPRRTGDRQFLTGTNVPAAVAVAGDTFTYRTNSLQQGVALFNYQDALKDILESLDVAPGDQEIPSQYGTSATLLDFHEIGAGGEVLGKLMGRAPDHGVNVDDKGVVYFYPVSNVEEEKQELARNPAPLVRGGFVRVTDLAFLRPARVDVLFTNEVENAFVYEEPQDDSVILEDAQKDILDRDRRSRLEPAIRLPVAGLEFRGIELAENSVVTQAVFYDSLARSSVYPLSPNNIIGPLSTEVLRQTFSRPWELDSQFVHFGPYVDRAYSRIVRAAQATYRSAFKITDAWVDACQEIKNERVRILDFVSLVRPRSPVYANFTRYPTERSLAIQARTDYSNYGWYVDDAIQSRIVDSKQAPAEVTGLDPESGFFVVRWQRSPYGDEDKIIPGIPEDRPVTAVASNVFLNLKAGTALEPEWAIVVILTLIPSAKNSDSHLTKITVTPSDAESVMNGTRIGSCKGPVMTVRMPANPRTTARYEYSDETAEQVRDFFFSEGALPREALVNEQDVQDLAKAAAARVYSTMLDRHSGSATYPAILENPRVRGSMQFVETTAELSGAIFTRYQFGAELRPRELADFLPTELRARVVGEVR